MQPLIDTSVRLKRRPVRDPETGDFEIVRAPRAGELVLRTLYTSVDPATRLRLREGKSYLPPFRLGDVIGTYSVCEVVHSEASGFAPGDVVTSFTGWQLHSVVKAAHVSRIAPEGIALSAYLGVLGWTGLTAHVGLEDIGRPKAGETVLVSAASGAVGSIAGQMVRERGARAVGITSGAERCRHLVEELGFAAALDRSAGDLAAQIDRACPDGIDVYFDNTGGEIQALAFARMRLHGRVILCGMMSQYNDETPPPGPNLMVAIATRLRSHHAERLLKAVELLGGGTLAVAEDADNPYVKPVRLPEHVLKSAAFFTSLGTPEDNSVGNYERWAGNESNDEIAALLRLNGREEGLHARRLSRVRELLA